MGMCFLPVRAGSSGAAAKKDKTERRETLSCFSITHRTLPQKRRFVFHWRRRFEKASGACAVRLRTNQLPCDTATRWEAEAAESPGAAGSQKSSGAQVERRSCRAHRGARRSRLQE